MLDKNSLKASVWMCTTHIPGTGADPDGPEIIRFAGIYLVDKNDLPPDILPKWDGGGDYRSHNLMIVGYQEAVGEDADYVPAHGFAEMAQRAFLEVISQGE